MPLTTPTSGDIEIIVNAHTNDAEYGRDLNRLQDRIVSLKTSVKAAFATLPQATGRSISKISDAFSTVFAGTVDVAYKSVTTIKKVFGAIGTIIKNVFGAIGTIIKNVLFGVLLLFALSIQKIIASLRESMKELINIRGGKLAKDTEETKGKFTELRAAIANAFLPLVEIAIPYIQMALDWLIKFFNYVAMITAAFAGQSTVMQVVAGSAAKLAKETEKTKKAALGALAAFDQINVLSKQTTDGTDTNAPTVETNIVPITDEILAKVQEIKDAIMAWWDDPIGKLQETWGKIADWFRANVIEPIAQWWNSTWFGVLLNSLLANFLDTWNSIYSNTAKTIDAIKEHVAQFFIGVSELIAGVFTGNWSLAWQGLKDIAAGAFGALWDIVKGVFENLSIFLFGWLNTLKIIVPDSIQKSFGAALDWISDKFRAVFNGIQGFVYNIVSNILGFINNIINTVLAGINSVLEAASSISGAFSVPNIGGASGGIGGLLNNIRIPGLATGAIVPARANMLAMIGEGSQSEIVAPDDKIRQIIREELSNAGGGGTIDNTIMLDGEVLYKATKRVERRHGTSLIAGGTV